MHPNAWIDGRPTIDDLSGHQYPALSGRSNFAKQIEAGDVATVDIVLSTQVLIEFCNNVFRPKDKRNLLTQSEVSKHSENHNQDYGGVRVINPFRQGS